MSNLNKISRFARPLIISLFTLTAGAIGVDFLYNHTFLSDPMKFAVVSKWSIVFHFLLIGVVGACIYIAMIILKGVLDEY